MSRRCGDPLVGEALVDKSGEVWLPYDAAKLVPKGRAGSPLSSVCRLRHAGRKPFLRRASRDGLLSIVNGMGVTLGDSIIGLNILAWLKEREPGLKVELYRSCSTPQFVERLYALANHVVDRLHYLPQPLHSLPADTVDLSDFLHWPGFATSPMVDFFAAGIGIASDSMPSEAKANRWLARLTIAPACELWRGRPYVLFCAEASTPLRSVPRDLAWMMVESIWQRYRLPILGFQVIDHPCYCDVSEQSSGLDEYLSWVKSAQVVVSTDSSAIHIAAGFDVPTLAVFTSIDPALRVRDYLYCNAVDISTPATRGLHQNAEPGRLREARVAWVDCIARACWPWPPTRTDSQRRVVLRKTHNPQIGFATNF